MSIMPCENSRLFCRTRKLQFLCFGKFNGNAWKLQLYFIKILAKNCNGNAASVQFCPLLPTPTPLSPPPSSSIASSNQDIMRAKQGCIPTLRAAGFYDRGPKPPGGVGVGGRATQAQDVRWRSTSPFPPKKKKKHWKKKKKKNYLTGLRSLGCLSRGTLRRPCWCLADTEESFSCSAHHIRQRASLPPPTHPPPLCHLAPCRYPPSTHDPPLAETWHTLGAAAAGLPLFQLQRHAPRRTPTPHPGPTALPGGSDHYVRVCVCVCLSVPVCVTYPARTPLYLRRFSACWIKSVPFISGILFDSLTHHQRRPVFDLSLFFYVWLLKYSSGAKSVRATPLWRAPCLWSLFLSL